MSYRDGDSFLACREWRVMRMRALERDGARCRCCGRTSADGITINVDHIKPRARFPELALTLDNLQVLCDECNHGKGNAYETRWHEPERQRRALTTRRPPSLERRLLWCLLMRPRIAESVSGVLLRTDSAESEALAAVVAYCKGQAETPSTAAVMQAFGGTSHAAALVHAIEAFPHDVQVNDDIIEVYALDVLERLEITAHRNNGRTAASIGRS